MGRRKGLGTQGQELAINAQEHPSRKVRAQNVTFYHFWVCYCEVCDVRSCGLLILHTLTILLILNISPTCSSETVERLLKPNSLNQLFTDHSPTLAAVVHYGQFG
jgi:hypothetical protein